LERERFCTSRKKNASSLSAGFQTIICLEKTELQLSPNDGVIKAERGRHSALIATPFGLNDNLLRSK